MYDCVCMSVGVLEHMFCGCVIATCVCEYGCVSCVYHCVPVYLGVVYGCLLRCTLF